MIDKELIKKVRLIEIATRHKVTDVFAGQYHSAFKGQGMEFAEVRQYVPGDDIRDIDWNVTARMQEPFIKKFTEERELTVMLVIDHSASMDFGLKQETKRNIAAQIAALLAFAAIKNNDKIGLLLHTDKVDHYVAPDKGSRHVMRIIRDIMSYKAEKTERSAIEPALNHLNHLKLRRSVIFFIGDFILPDSESRILKVTARKHDLVGILINDPAEFNLPNAGIIPWRDLESGQEILIDTSSKKVRDTFVRRQQIARAKQLDALRRSGLDTVEILNGQDYTRQLVQFMRARTQRISRS